ncbi:unnamed protein product [Rotaria magnacalcarata]|uniref:BTB domain-containing protein n=2 Tax=Rotaria magnacalcarata TaxID=392030 RepID=A0A819RG32_9BILA|nr:unnamed protein product [Rotaria magnacalcarata]CAF4051760.1 unnamed protein product [Rotaria magnacalcarata]
MQFAHTKTQTTKPKRSNSMLIHDDEDFDISLSSMSIGLSSKLRTHLSARNCCDCRLVYTCNGLSSAVLCHRLVLSASSVYFRLFLKYNQPQSAYDSSQQCYLNEYHCTFNFTEKTLLTCIDLLYADENLQQCPQNLLFYDDLLNGMMFLGLPDEYFIKILILLRSKLLSLTGDVEKRHLIASVAKSQLNDKFRKAFLARSLCLINDRSEFNCGIKHIYNSRSYYDSNRHTIVLNGSGDSRLTYKGIIFQANAQFSTDCASFWFTCQRAFRSFNVLRARLATLYVYDGISQTIVERIPNPDCKQMGYQLRLPRGKLVLSNFLMNCYQVVVKQTFPLSEHVAFNFVIELIRD